MLDTATYDDVISKRKSYALMRSEMLNVRASWEPHWMELANFVKPRRIRLFASERNRGEKRNQKIMDSTAGYCLEILRSGMHTGLTSPASPWLELSLTDTDMAAYLPVKVWLAEVTRVLLMLMQKSNLYNILPTLYGDQALFATGAMATIEDTEDAVRSYSYPIGSYAAGLDQRGKVSSFMREFTMTVRDVVKEFGLGPGTRNIDWTNISQTVKQMWDLGKYTAAVDVTQVITPNDEFNPSRYESQYKRFASCWFETGSTEEKFLRESGYNEMPVFMPRWEATGEDTYGTESPGMVALADIKGLQVGERRGLQALEKMLNPPLQAPTSMQRVGVSVLPGGTNYHDVHTGQEGIRSIYDVRFPIDQLEVKQQAIRQRLERNFYTNLFLMMASSQTSDITAREVAERHEEKLLALGPVVQRNDDELLTPLVFRHLAIANRRGLIPPAPAEAQGQEMTLTYISMMHQAQKLVKVSGQERFIQNIGELSQFFPEVRAKVSIFDTVDVYADMLSIEPKQLRTNEAAQAIVDEQNRAAAQQAAVDQASAGAGAVKSLAGADMSSDNVLKRMIQGAGGVTGAPAA